MMTTAAAVLLAFPIQAPPKASSPETRAPTAQTENAKKIIAHIRQGRRALAARVTKAHRGDNEAPIDRYKATITISSLGKQAETLDVRLEVRYGAKIVRAKGAPPVEMIRYTVDEGDKPLERGKDPTPWQRIGDRVTRLSGRGDPVGRKLLASHTRLCKQMLQFLDPGAILRGLRGVDPVRTASLRLGRSKKIETDFISGKLGSFPVFHATDKSVQMRAVFMEAWVDKKTSRLAAVQIYPLALDGKPRFDAGEFIALGDYVTSNGILIPRELLICDTNGATRQPRAKVKLSAFELNAKLTKADFVRPH